MDNRQAAASRQGRAFEEQTKRHLIAQGYDIIHERWKEPKTLVEIDFVVSKPGNTEVLWIECKGSWESPRNGLMRSDTLKKAIACGFLLSTVKPDNVKYVIITSHKPVSEAGLRWMDLSLGTVFDALWVSSWDFDKSWGSE